MSEVTRQQVAGILKRHVCVTVLALAEEQFDPSKSPADMGADSIDLVEIVSGASGELGVNVPRPALRSARTVDELVDAFYAAACAQRAAEPDAQP